MNASLYAVAVDRPRRADGKPYRDYVRATCTCGWHGPMTPTRTIEGFTLAERDAENHRNAHAHHTGFFDPMKGWLAS